MARHKDISDTPADCYTIDEFCARNRFSKTKYYELKGEGRGPVEIHLGKVRLITKESAARWRAALDAESERARDAEAEAKNTAAAEPDEKGRYRIGDPAEPQEPYDSKRSRALRKLFGPTPEDVRHLRAAQDAETKAKFPKCAK